MGKSIIIIDDDPRIRNMYKAALDIQGFDVTETDGQKFLNGITKFKQKPDLILLDIMMPKVNGLDVLDILKAKPETKDIKVMMITALSDAASRKRALDSGAHSYLVKSELTMSEIIEKIKVALID